MRAMPTVPNSVYATLRPEVYEQMFRSGAPQRFSALILRFPLRAAVAQWSRTATAGSDVVQSGRPIFDDFFQHLWPYIGNNTANVVFQMVKRLWLIRIDQ
ncbi:hypothetical protein TNCV_1178361 [Trichonephila clavipes]|nr:hypothetical protein TNCV_1178361 [Trichonephila clavipes]